MKMFSELLLLIFLVFIFCYLFFYSAGNLLSPSAPQNNNKVCFGLNCFSVELAKTVSERDRGLMGRKQLEESSGMLFIFDKEGVYPFWMKNTLIPLDMIWINANYEVVFIGRNIQPCKGLICPEINPLVKANYVLEVNGGISEKIGIKVGDTAKIMIR